MRRRPWYVPPKNCFRCSAELKWWEAGMCDACVYRED